MENQSNSIVVRCFVSTDADAVISMVKELAAFHGDEARATRSDVLQFASGEHAISDIIVVLLNGDICAFSAAYNWINYIEGFLICHIDLFYVRESARGRGVGSALLKQLAHEAKSSGCQRVTVGAEPDNEDANAFYQRMGFKLRRSGSNRYALSGAALDQLTIA